LPRPAHDQRRGEPQLEVAMHLGDEMPPRPGKNRQRAPLPPGIHPPQIERQGIREVQPEKKREIRLFHHVLARRSRAGVQPAVVNLSLILCPLSQGGAAR
jgi:hypothetical protein